MQTAYLVTILLKPAKPVHPNDWPSEVFRFATSLPEHRAGHLAGCCIDALADYWGREFDYRIEPLPFVDGATASHEIVQLATGKVSI